MAKPKPSGELVPAFESSLGLGDPDAPVMVDKAVLEHFNQELATSGRHTVRHHIEAANVAALYAKRAIRPDEIAALRRQMFNVVTNGLKEVEKVIEGKKDWSAAQVRLFSVLTERVMPKLSTITTEHPGEKRLEDMSVEELEAIALGKKKAEAIDVVAKEADKLDKKADFMERRRANSEIKHQLASVVSLDDAEKRYIARKATRYSLKEEERRTAFKLFKPQPSPSPEQLERMREVRQGGLAGLWRRKGVPEEEIRRREEERRAKISSSKAHLREARQRREAMTMGLGDAKEVPKDIATGKSKILKEFRVSPLKGVRKQSTILKQQQREQERQVREKERRENPRIYSNTIQGVPPGTKLRLRDLRKFRPDLFEEAKA